MYQIRVKIKVCRGIIKVISVWYLALGLLKNMNKSELTQIKSYKSSSPLLSPRIPAMRGIIICIILPPTTHLTTNTASIAVCTMAGTNSPQALKGYPLAQLKAPPMVKAHNSDTTAGRLMPSALPACHIFIIWGSWTKNDGMTME